MKERCNFCKTEHDEDYMCQAYCDYLSKAEENFSGGLHQRSFQD